MRSACICCCPHNNTSGVFPGYSAMFIASRSALEGARRFLYPSNTVQSTTGTIHSLCHSIVIFYLHLITPPFLFPYSCFLVLSATLSLLSLPSPLLLYVSSLFNYFAHTSHNSSFIVLPCFLLPPSLPICPLPLPSQRTPTYDADTTQSALWISESPRICRFAKGVEESLVCV